MTDIKIITYEHTHVKIDGTFENQPGSIHTEGHISISHPKGGCGLGGCNCSPGHWISAALPLDNGIVRGMRLQFKSRKQLLEYLGVE
jgi:hypothetical protein